MARAQEQVQMQAIRNNARAELQQQASDQIMEQRMLDGLASMGVM